MQTQSEELDVTLPYTVSNAFLWGGGAGEEVSPSTRLPLSPLDTLGSLTQFAFSS